MMRVKIWGYRYRSEATDKEMPKAGSNYNCFAVILLDFVLTKDENNYPQVFLKECKYIGKKMTRYITDDLENFSDNSDESEEE